MRTRRITVALALGLVLTLGFYSLMAVAQDAPHKENKHLSQKALTLSVPALSGHAQSGAQKGEGKFLAKKLAPWQRAELGAWLFTPMIVISALLAPWTYQQYHDIKRTFTCARNSSFC